ncbi:Avirulence (Avh) protein [Phytophthora megakarya]|uniref:Avirulence (Avh) protein n=1 Tax=Phytophthora megakarya TaxID=4795 RepID=A0A225WGP3_9STRA|nr:Avirulence (Avh) protein [Phytophthora megakarya]
MSAISSLTKQYGDDVLFEMIKTAKTNPHTKGLAIELETKQMQHWAITRMDPDKIFHLFMLNTVRSDILENPKFATTWVNYMEVFNSRYPAEKTTMMEMFTKSFGDVGVTKMLHVGKEKNWARNLAIELNHKQLKMWLDSGKSVDDVFELLKLDKQEVIFRDQSLLYTWVSYLNFLINQYPDNKAALFTALKSRFEDRQLNEILNAAKKFPKMENDAIKIQTDKIQAYLASNESPRHVFRLLGIANEGDGILGSPLFQTWLKYVKDFNRRNPKQRHESWFDPLCIDLEWGGNRMIKEAMKNPSTMSIGKKVENEWLSLWLDRKKLPTDVFRWLGLSENALADRRFKTWTTYLDDFNQRYPTQKITLIEGLREHYNDSNLLRMFNAAKKDPSTKTLVTNVEDMLINSWIVEKRTLTDLRKQLGRVENSDDIIQRYIKKLTATKKNTA